MNAEWEKLYLLKQPDGETRVAADRWQGYLLERVITKYHRRTRRYRAPASIQEVFWKHRSLVGCGMAQVVEGAIPRNYRQVFVDGVRG